MTVDTATVIGGNNLVKVDNGQLILPFANIYGGTTDIKAGWITIENSVALGSDVPSQRATRHQRQVHHRRRRAHRCSSSRSPTACLTMTNNFILTGLGITHPFGLISGSEPGDGGAIENLDGNNTLLGIIQLDGVAGLGVENVFPNSAGTQLNLTGDLYNFTNGALVTSGGITKLGSQRLVIEGPGTYTGPVAIANGVLLDQNDTGLGIGSTLGPTGIAGALPTVTEARRCRPCRRSS